MAAIERRSRLARLCGSESNWLPLNKSSFVEVSNFEKEELERASESGSAIQIRNKPPMERLLGPSESRLGSESQFINFDQVRISVELVSGAGAGFLRDFNGAQQQATLSRVSIQTGNQID